MKKKAIVILSLIVFLCSGIFPAYAADDFELPSISIHSFGSWEVTTEPTCTNGGRRIRRCTKCSAIESEYIAPLGHNFGEWTQTAEEVPANCTAAGVTAIETRTCSRCEATETRGGNVINALGHDYTESVIPPTCTEMGYTAHTCSRCNDSFNTDYTDANGHTPGETSQENIVEATHETGGSYDEVVYCSVCSAELSRIKRFTDPDEHKPGEAQQENLVEATCTVNGSYDEVIYCTECNAEISRTNKTINATGHDFSVWTQSAPEVPATCTTAGSTAVETSKCSHCDAVETRGGTVIDALGHDYANTVVTPPTCTEKGYTTYSCTRCDSTYTDNITDETGHSPAAPVKENVVEPTYTSTGSYEEVIYCSVCNTELFRKTKTTPKLSLPTEDGEFEGEKIPFTEIDEPTTKPASEKRPKATSIKKLKKGRKSFKAVWKKVKGVSGYQLQYSTNKKFKKKIKGKKHTVKKISVKKAKSTKKTVKKLKAKKKYYVRIRTYKVVKGKRIYSKWSKVKAVKTK